MRVRLVNQDLHLELDPAAGGSVSALRWGDQDVLRPAPQRLGPAFDPLQYAAFPMVPFVGRIHHGVFAANQRHIRLHPNLPPEPHTIHGYGWKSAWKVTDQTELSITLSHHHSADAWPWSYDATQTFRLEPQALIVSLSVTNRGDSDMPAGLGWHPYFHRAGATLTLPTIAEWCPDDDTGNNVPNTIRSERDLSDGAAVDGLKLDTSFRIAQPEIQIAWPTYRVKIISDRVFAHATVFVPPGQDFFCVEPITHAPNAVNSAIDDSLTGQHWLAPDDSLSGTIRMMIER